MFPISFNNTTFQQNPIAKSTSPSNTKIGNVVKPILEQRVSTEDANDRQFSPAQNTKTHTISLKEFQEKIECYSQIVLNLKFPSKSTASLSVKDNFNNKIQKFISQINEAKNDKTLIKTITEELDYISHFLNPLVEITGQKSYASILLQALRTEFKEIISNIPKKNLFNKIGNVFYSIFQCARDEYKKWRYQSIKEDDDYVDTSLEENDIEKDVVITIFADSSKFTWVNDCYFSQYKVTSHGTEELNKPEHVRETYESTRRRTCLRKFSEKIKSFSISNLQPLLTTVLLNEFNRKINNFNSEIIKPENENNLLNIISEELNYISNTLSELILDKQNIKIADKDSTLEHISSQFGEILTEFEELSNIVELAPDFDLP